jgi:hypothetical protein
MKFHRATFTSKSTYLRYYGRARRLLMNQAAGFHPSSFRLRPSKCGDFGGNTLFISQHFDELS